MLTSLFHRTAHGHHGGALLVALVATVVAVGGPWASTVGAPTPRAEVTVVTEPAVEAEPVAPVATPDGSGVVTVAVPTADDIRAQCVAAGLAAECRAAGVR